MPHTIIFVLIISFIASLVRSTLGFGESLIAVPLLLLFLPAAVAVPLSVMLSIVIALVVVIQDYKQVHFFSAKWLILFALPGIPAGIAVLIYGNEFLIKTALGVLLILYSAYTLFVKQVKPIKEDNMLWLFICGFLSGIFGGAYGLNGPALVIYGNKRQWSAKHFRVTLQAYFLPVSFIAASGYYSQKLITPEVYTYFFAALTTTIPAIFLGRYLNHKLKDVSFFKYVYGALIILGIILVITALPKNNVHIG